MSDTLASLRRKIDGAGDLQSVVETMKTRVAWIALCGCIEKSAGKYQRKRCDLPILREGVCVQRSVRRCHKLIKLILRAVLLGALYSVLISSVMAQETIGKSGELQKPTAPAKEEIFPAPAKVDVNPVARDGEIFKRLQSVLEATNWFTNPQVRVEKGVVFLGARWRPKS
jgi:hypothetical protein